jgi:lauroyl/myristoyl acyltransferase
VKFNVSLTQVFHGLSKLLGYGLCRLLPIDWVSDFGARRGRYSKAKEQQLLPRLENNLRFLGVQEPSQAIRQLRQASGRASLEMLIADRIVRDGRIAWEKSDAVDAMIRDRRPLVFCSIHLANLGDVLGAAVVSHIANKVSGYRMGGSTRHISDPTDRWIANHSRKKLLGQEDAWISSPKSGLARQMLRELQTPPSVLLLHVDESRHHQVHCPTFGRAAPKSINLKYAIGLAKRSGACLVPVYLLRDNDTGHDIRSRKTTVTSALFTIHTLRVIDFTQPDLNEQEVFKQLDQDFEQVVRAYPEQWLQLYHARLIDE